MAGTSDVFECALVEHSDVILPVMLVYLPCRPCVHKTAKEDAWNLRIRESESSEAGIFHLRPWSCLNSG